MCNSCFGGSNCTWIILLILIFLAFSNCGCGNNNGCGCGNARDNDCGIPAIIAARSPYSYCP